MPTLKPEQEQVQSVCSGDRRSGWPTGATAISLTGTGAGTQRKSEHVKPPFCKPPG